MQRRTFNLALLAALATADAGAQSQSQSSSYPTRPVRFIVGSAPGATPDVFARMVAQHMAESWGGTEVIVDNRSGASGMLAADMVAKAAPDGYTLLFADSSAWAINPHLFSKLPYDPAKDLIPVLQVGSLPMFLVVSSALPVDTVPALIAYAKRNPGKLTYGSAGNGSIHHISAELFKSMAGLDIVHVPYKGAAQVGIALMAGEVDMAFMGYTAVSQGVASGKVRVLAIATDKRSAAFPQLPTLAESGLPGFSMAATAGLMAPANTPAAIVAKLQAAAAAAANLPDTVTRLSAMGVLVAPGSTAQFAVTAAAERERFGRLVKLSGAHVD